MNFKILLQVLKHHLKEPLVTTLMILMTMVIMWLFMVIMDNSVIARWIFGLSILVLPVGSIVWLVFDFVRGIVEDYKLQSRIEDEEQ